MLRRTLNALRLGGKEDHYEEELIPAEEADIELADIVPEINKKPAANSLGSNNINNPSSLRTTPPKLLAGGEGGSLVANGGSNLERSQGKGIRVLIDNSDGSSQNGISETRLDSSYMDVVPLEDVVDIEALSQSLAAQKLKEEGLDPDSPHVGTMKKEESASSLDTTVTSWKKPLLYSLIAAIGSLTTGYASGYTAPVKDSIKDDLSLSSYEYSLFAAILNIGGLFGALLGGPLIEWKGRKWTMCIASVPLCLGYVAIAAAQNFSALVFGRILVGLGVGSLSVTVPVYISEISPTRLRGSLGSFHQLFGVIGVTAAYSIGVGVSWRYLAVIAAIISALFIVLVIFILPKSPPFLKYKGQYEEALEALKQLHDADIAQEYPEVLEARHYHPPPPPETDAKDQLGKKKRSKAKKDASNEGDKFAKMKELFSKPFKKAMIIGIGITLCVQFCGISPVIYFTGKIISESGISNVDLATIILFTIRIFLTIASTLTIDKVGRRVLLLIGGLGLMVGHMILGVAFQLKDTSSHGPSGWVALIGAFLFLNAFTMGIGPVSGPLQSELYPIRLRGTAMSICTVVNFGVSFIIVMTFNTMLNTITRGGTFFFYAVCCLLGVLFIRLGVPETKGFTMEQIERHFTKGEKLGDERKANKTTLISIPVFGTVFLLSVAWAVASTRG